VLPETGTPIDGAYFLSTLTYTTRSQAVSTDRGATWTQVTLPAGLNNMIVIGGTGHQLYARADNSSGAQTFLTSTDHGITWTTLDAQLSTLPATRVTAAVLPGRGLLVDNGRQITSQGSAAPPALVIAGFGPVALLFNADSNNPATYTSPTQGGWQPTKLS
jgi:hypothetical protein